MPASTTVMGMVLSAMPVGDYDKRLVILTKEFGKISVFAKGARRPNSALLACSQTFTFGEFTLYPGRSSYSIISVEIKNYFSQLREEFDAVCYGMYFCEVVDYVTKENNDETDILKLLYQTLRALTKKTIDFSLIRAVFELKLFALNGEAPQVFQCVKCGKELSDHLKYAFSIRSGGVLCDPCDKSGDDILYISTSTLYTMQYIISQKLEKLYTFRVKSDVLDELQRCLKKYAECYLDHEFKSLDMLRTL